MMGAHIANTYNTNKPSSVSLLTSYGLCISGNTSMEKVTSCPTAELDFANIAGQSDGSGAGSRRNAKGEQNIDMCDDHDIYQITL